MTYNNDHFWYDTRMTPEMLLQIIRYFSWGTRRFNGKSFQFFSRMAVLYRKELKIIWPKIKALFPTDVLPPEGRIVWRLNFWWLFFASLGGGFGDFSGSLSLVDSFDDTDSNGLSHVTDGETSKRWVLREGLYAHWLKQNFKHDVKHDFKTF